MHDENLWLEDIDGQAALDWVRERNAEVEETWFTDAEFVETRSRILGILDSDDRIPEPGRIGDQIYNFWTDAEHRRGIMRRMPADAYLDGSGDWETVLDVDALGAAEGESWVFAGMRVRTPDHRRALVALSPGGGDATTTREFDLVTKRFVPADEGGFVRPAAKGELVWIDADSVYVTSDFGPGSLTRSGYARTVRRWNRGDDMSAAEVVFEADGDDMGVWVSVSTMPGHRHHLIDRALDFYRFEYHLVVDGRPVRLDLPDDVSVSVHERWATLRNRNPWAVGGRTHPPGTVLVAKVDDLLAGRVEPTAVLTPDDHCVVEAVAWTRHRLLVTTLTDVRTVVRVLTPPGSGSDQWSATDLPGAPDTWTVTVAPVDADDSDDVWVWSEDFLTPRTLSHLSGEGVATVIRREPLHFDTTGLAISQHFATSRDGTRIPYFQVGPSAMDGPRPTMLRGYGGFEVSETAVHGPALGAGWLDAGGVYVQANLRGGGEYGPTWHQAGLRENRHRIYEDFEAVADDLVARGVTTPAQLGCTGGSNGGLLVGNMYVRSPQRFGAIVCQVPLLDMARYHLLLAGASWMAEYGDPDEPSDWEFLSRWSPYQLVRPEVDHPPILLTTSTRDDRVHPGHARKMAARLSSQGKDVTYWENIEGGHGGAADAEQQATMRTLGYLFLARHLG